MLDLSPEWFSRFERVIYQECGIRLDMRKRSSLATRLERRMQATGIGTIEQYYRRITSAGGDSERLNLIDSVTTNETFFFRTQSHFDWFRKDFIDEIVKRNRSASGKPSVRVWSAACADGAEPYSLAICLSEHGLRLQAASSSILATDVSAASLAKAKVGRYKQRSVENVEKDRLSRYFRVMDDEPAYEIRQRYRQLVTFRQHNLMEPIQSPPFDCIFLRNVLIYFDRTSKQQVVNRMADALKPGGYLVIGPSEGIFGLKNPLAKLKTFLYRKSD